MMSDDEFWDAAYLAALNGLIASGDPWGAAVPEAILVANRAETVRASVRSVPDAMSPPMTDGPVSLP